MGAVRIRLPKARCGEPDYEIVAVNGRRWQILRGVSVAVPEAVADYIRARGLYGAKSGMELNG